MNPSYEESLQRKRQNGHFFKKVNEKEENHYKKHRKICDKKENILKKEIYPPVY